MYKLTFSALLLSAVLVACPSPNGSTITSVSLTPTTSSVSLGGSSTITASVVGTGGFSRIVDWNIVSGGGTLIANGAGGMRFNAPNIASTTVIRATSRQDSSKFGSVTIVTN